ncbi:MAG: hypothetical protein AAF517_00940 [Planctomycetota bacterium]
MILPTARLDSPHDSRVTLRLLAVVIAGLGLFVSTPSTAQEEPPPKPETSGSVPQKTSPLTPEDLAPRVKKLDEWTREPVALDESNMRLLFDRRDSSFYLHEHRSQRRFYSSWHRRGFASVHLRDGRVLIIDQAKAVNASGERIRFRGASSQGEVPEIRFTISKTTLPGSVSFEYGIAEANAAEVEGVTLLDRVLWTTYEAGGGVSVAHGNGRWFDASVKEDLKETFHSDLRADPAGVESERALTAMVAGVQFGPTTLLLFWDDPKAQLTVHRENVDADFPRPEDFPGTGMQSISLYFPGSNGRAYVVGGLLDHVGHLEIGRSYRSVRSDLFRESSLRYKSGKRRELGKFSHAPLFRASIRGPATPPFANGDVTRKFSDIAAATTRLSETLKLPSALVLLDSWSALPPPEAADRVDLSAEPSAGGDAGLTALVESAHSRGYLVGLTLDRGDLVPPRQRARSSSVDLWSQAADAALKDGALGALKDRSKADLLLVREPYGEGSGVEESTARSLFYARTAETFELFGSTLGTELDLHAVSLLEGFFDPKSLAENLNAALPVYPSVYGQHVRAISGLGRELRANDSAAALVCLLFGQTPVFPLFSAEPGGESEKVGDGPEWSFARDEGWAKGKGLSPQEIFTKNLFEICSVAARFQTREPLAAHRKLTPDGLVRESVFGYDMRIIVNFGKEPYLVEEHDVLLPQYGFVLRYPFFYAFHALEAEGLKYDRPAFFTVLSLEGKMYLRAEKTRLYHGFGPNKIRVGGRDFVVDGESEVRVW